MPGILPKTPLRVRRGKLTLRLGGKHAALASERLFNRLRQLGRLVGREAAIVAD
jgi:exopolyphosphatase/guanosine-5'-triphosphate,3'-diphosphate pyrophosphatase